ncbi:VOC family protein [Ruegeria sp. HKCCD6119]|uniref:VOC family protein n=1 Tax=Ruegeria sp. HKCCD6119 TaxID=2683003 RepID=UPI0014913212|nr:VOC family protein [Ruegeria sp. HKCCD6119]NOD83107.1 VOC family protein [Ruegeria sp. HKCCD6119]
MKQKLHAVTLVVPDYDDALAFYTERLGFQLLKDIDLGGGKRWVLITPPGSDGGALLLAKADGPEKRAAIGNQTGGRVGFFIQTDDFQRDYTQMRANGVHFEETPRVETYGTVAVWCDPYDNRWDLIQFT